MYEAQGKNGGSGPLFTEEYEQFRNRSPVLNEAEITLPLFIEDLKNGSPKKIYHSDEFADITKSPLPDYSLLKTGKYATAGIQYSRGCPYDCEFCDITGCLVIRSGQNPAQIVAELDQLFTNRMERAYSSLMIILLVIKRD